MVYAIKECKAAACCAGGCYGKDKKYPQKAAAPEVGPAEKAGTEHPDPDHLRQLYCCHRAGHAAAHPAYCQQARTAGCAQRHVHSHQRHLRHRSGGAGYVDAVHMVRAGSGAAAYSGGRPWSCYPYQLFCAGHAPAHGLPGSALAGRKRLGRRLRSGQKRAEDRGGAGSDV